MEKSTARSLSVFRLIPEQLQTNKVHDTSKIGPKKWVARLHSPEVQDSADGGSRYKLAGPDYAACVFVSLDSPIFSLQINLFRSSPSQSVIGGPLSRIQTWAHLSEVFFLCFQYSL
jgi:hypothetical protein